MSSKLPNDGKAGAAGFQVQGDSMSRAVWVGLLAVAIHAAGWASKGSASNIELVFSETASFVGAFFARDVSRRGSATGKPAVAGRATGRAPTSARRGALLHGTFSGPTRA